MNLLALLGSITMSAASPVTVIEPSLTTREKTIPSIKYDSRNRVFKSDVEIQRMNRIKNIYGTATPIFDNLRKPQTWDDLWYDILLVNGYQEADFNKLDVQRNIDQIKNLIGIRDEIISDTYGKLIRETPIVTSKKIINTSSYFLRNEGDIIQKFKTNEKTTKTITREEWSLEKNAYFKYSMNVGVKFLIFSGSTGFEIGLNLKSEMKKEVTREEQITIPSQTIILAPKTKTRVDWITTETITNIPSVLQYDISKRMNKNRADTNLELFNNYKSHSNGNAWTRNRLGTIDFDRTLWLIANQGKEKYFTDNSKDLFVISSWETDLNNNSIFGGLANEYIFNLSLSFQQQAISSFYDIKVEPLN